MDTSAYWAALHRIPTLGPRRLLRLVNALGSAKAVWEATEKQLRALPQVESAVIDSMIMHRPGIILDEIWQSMVNNGIKVLTIEDSSYPLNLKRINDPPPVLYYKGELPFETLHIAVIGARKATPYGKKVAEQLGLELAQAGVVVTSGMARGIDTYAHRGALKGKGFTIAVLGSGLDVVYPPENKGLMDEIIEHGMVISEYLPGTQPEAKNFPIRNRIISGLSDGTVVVEAGEKSGALITVDFALEQGRDVFAVPGPVTSSMSRGSNGLIKQGAKLVQDINDILEEYKIVQTLFPNDPGTGTDLTGEEQRVLEQLSAVPVQLDDLACLTGLTISRLNVILTYLEIKGAIRQLPGKFYIAS
ncbi:MAG: DNA-processing protein DprA [Bacillota bacterium]